MQNTSDHFHFNYGKLYYVSKDEKEAYEKETGKWGVALNVNKELVIFAWHERADSI